MSGFLLLCVLCLGALPVMLAWYTGVELIAPLFWRVRLLRQARSVPKQLPASTGVAGLEPTTRAEVAALLADATATRVGPYTRDFAATLHGLPVYLRTQARVVNEGGGLVSIPYTLEEQSAARIVVAVFVVADLRGRVPGSLTFHVEVGDEERGFGDEGLVSGLLDGRARARFGKGDRLTLSDAVLVFESPFLLADRVPGPVVEEVARMAARLADACAPAGGAPDVFALLRENLEQDASERVRAAAAALLVPRFPEAADRVAALALGDPSPEVRLAAARHLGEEGHAILEAIAFDAPEEGAPSDGLRQRALRFLIRELPRERVLPLLERALREGPDALRQTAIRQVGELRHRPAVEWLRGLPDLRDPETVAAGCEALARIGDAGAEGTLIELLDRSEEVVIRAAVEAIAQVGTFASVRPLMARLERTSNRELRLSIATTLQLVESRGAPEGLGALSLIDEGETAGQLALVAGDDADPKS